MNCQNQPWTFGIHEHFYESCSVKLSLIASINSKYTLNSYGQDQRGITCLW